MSELRKAFYHAQKMAGKMSKAQSRFSHALADSKFYDVQDLPDEVVDCVDYGTVSLTYREFYKLMLDALEDLD